MTAEPLLVLSNEIGGTVTTYSLEARSGTHQARVGLYPYRFADSLTLRRLFLMHPEGRWTSAA